MKSTKNPEVIQNAILKTLAKSTKKTGISPIEVAKELEPDARIQRRWMNGIKHEAIILAKDGKIAITRKGKVQDPNGEIKGVIRYTKVAS